MTHSGVIYPEFGNLHSSCCVQAVEAAQQRRPGAAPPAPLDAGAVQRLASLVASLDDVESQYRLASRLGLRSVVRRLLSSPALPYLKDVAWKTPHFS